MRASTRQLALRAAAKASLSVTFLAACGGVTVIDHAEPREDAGGEPDESRVEASVTPDATPIGQDTASDGSLACNPPSVASKEPPSTGTFECCLRSVEGMLGADGLSDAAAKNPTDLACCNAVVAGYNAGLGVLSEAGQDLFSCCVALEEDGISTRLPDGGFGACEPWGPPVPPEMPIDAFGREAVA